MKRYIIYELLIVFLLGCTPKETDDNCLVLNVKMEDKGISFNELFKQIELIPLETNDSSYIKQIEDLFLFNDTLFVFDRGMKSLYIFDGVSGKHINTIMKVGQGPGEYTFVDDVIVDTLHRTAVLLSPFCFINTYNYDGQFIKRTDLPVPPVAYNHIKEFNDSTYIVWGHTWPNPENLGGIVLIQKQTHQILNSYWKIQGVEGSFVYSPFWNYHNNVYFSTAVTNKVYQITMNDCILAYRWNFSKYNIDKYRESEIINVELKERTPRLQRIIREMASSEVLYKFYRKFENEKYYYAQIILKNEKNLSPHVFYQKETGKSYYFLKTTEGLMFLTYLLSDDYLIGELFTNNADDLLKSNLLSEKDRLTLKNLKFDSNPVLVKLYFK